MSLHKQGGGDKNTQPHKTHLTVTYPYHPLCGQTVTVIYKMPRGNVEGWHVRADDDRVWRIERWMTLPRWRMLQVSSTPLIAPVNLLGLYRRLEQIRVPSCNGTDTASDTA